MKHIHTPIFCFWTTSIKRTYIKPLITQHPYVESHTYLFQYFFVYVGQIAINMCLDATVGKLVINHTMKFYNLFSHRLLFNIMFIKTSQYYFSFTLIRQWHITYYTVLLWARLSLICNLVSIMFTWSAVARFRSLMVAKKIQC